MILDTIYYTMSLKIGEGLSVINNAVDIVTYSFFIGAEEDVEIQLFVNWHMSYT